MFNNYEALKCGKCDKSFTGRRPAEGGGIFCPDCIVLDELSVVNEGDKIPKTVNDEHEGGRGEG